MVRKRDITFFVKRRQKYRNRVFVHDTFLRMGRERDKKDPDMRRLILVSTAARKGRIATGKVCRRAVMLLI